MEPGDRAAQALNRPRAAGVTRFRLVAVCFLLVGLSFVQDPGLLTSDTKFDLVEAPGRFLARSLHLWDPQGALGQLQNQAYGYLWPMGPFHLLGELVGLPGWAVQRSWLALVLCVAFLGTALLVRALGVRSDLATVVAGLAFALSPRMLTTLGPISIEAWPSALAPWVLLPLVVGASVGSPRRAAVLSAFAVAMVGGVNAAATFAVLPLGAIWLLTRTPGPRRRALMVWWPLFTLLGTLWWLVPLFVMGAYSPPFLDFIETTQVTTFPTDLFDTLRGTSDWVPYVSAASRAGNDLLVQGFLPFASGVVLLVGFAGLLDRRHPHRLFLALSLLVGVLMVAAGHLGPVTGWWAGDVRGLLDGSLAPLRNVHKFDPIVRLPLVIGLALVLDGARRGRHGEPDGEPGEPGGAVAVGALQARLERLNSGSLVAMALVAVAAAAAPAFTTHIAPADPVLAVPGYWDQTARWLDAHQGQGSSMLVPGSGFADYVWGSPKDEPLQYLTRASWTVRNQIPLTPTGNIRMLSAIEDRFTQGAGSAGLTDQLRRAGVHWLVVRNDLRRSNDVPDPVLVHQTLAESPGITRRTSFGPVVGGDPYLVRDGVRTLINGGWQSRYAAVEIFEVSSADQSGSATTAPAVVAGGPEDLISLADLGVLGARGDEPTVLASDVRAGSGGSGRGSGALSRGPLVLTDGLRAREDSFPRIHDGYSAALTPGDVRRSGSRRRDYLEPGQDRWSTRVALEGAKAISASSSGSDSNALGGSRRGELPYAAVDGSADSQWVSDPGVVGQSWWRIDLDRRTPLGGVTLTGGDSASPRQSVRVVTSEGRSKVVGLGPDERATIRLDGAPVSWLRVEAPPGASDTRLALAEVSIPGVSVVRRLVLPTLPGAWGDPDDVVLRTDLDDRQGCVAVGLRLRCVPAQQHASEEQTGLARGFSLAGPKIYFPAVTVRARPGQALTDLLLAQQPVGVSATAVALADPRASPLAAIDDDPDTTWVAKADVARPSLRLNWLRPRRVTGISITVPPDVAARRPTRVTLVWPRGSRTVDLDARGNARFPALRTARLQVRIDRARTTRSLDFAAQGTDVGIGIGDLRLRGVDYLPVVPSTQQVGRGCGSGPTLQVDGSTYRTAVRASAAQILTGAAVPALVCEPGGATAAPSTAPAIAFNQGAHDLEVPSSPAFDPVSVVLSGARTAASTPVVATDAHATSPGPERLSLRPGVSGAAGAVVSVPQSINPGWVAQWDGRRLTPVQVDGWKQAWVLPAGADGRAASVAPGAVTARFAPDTAYRVGLGVGLLALLGLGGLVLLLFRRPGRSDHQPLGARQASTVATALAALVLAGLVAGWWGVVAGEAVVVASRWLQRRRPDVAPWLLAAPCVVVGLAFFVRPWADPTGWAGSEHWVAYVMLVPLVAAIGSAGSRRPRFFRLISGPSTRR